MKSVNEFGQSGALIEELDAGDPYVLKRGNERVGRQGRWMVEHPSLIIPRVYINGTTWYVMERLFPGPLPSPALVLDELYSNLWQWRTDIGCTTDYHESYIYRKANIIRDVVDPNFEFETNFIADLNWVLEHWVQLPACTVHGDTTASNIMFSATGQLKFIDPSSDYVVGNIFPNTPALDVGKLLLSALGYERERFGRQVDWTYDDVLDAAAYYLSGIELRAAQHFCAMHFFTSIPYTPKEHQQMMVDLMHEAILRSRTPL